MKSINEIKLSSGSHETREDGACFMEAVAYIAGEKHSDHPACVCPVLGSFLRSWNDCLPDADREDLKPYLRLVIGTSGDGHSSRRSWMALDWLIRVHVPAFLELTPRLLRHAETLRALPEVVDAQSLPAGAPRFQRNPARRGEPRSPARSLGRALSLLLAPGPDRLRR